jgi:hypothetical protein
MRTLQGIYLHSCMYVLHVIHSHRYRHVLSVTYLPRHIHALHMTNNSRRVPPFQPIGDRTTFKIKLRPNIQTKSIKGVFKIKVIIIKIINQMAHQLLRYQAVLIGATTASSTRYSVTSMLRCLFETPSRSNRRLPRQ